MYGVDMSKPGAQSYYNSVFKLFAEWGVDFVNVDDIVRPYHEKEIEGVRNAIDASHRPMVLSLSPGETRPDAAAHAREHANMWRISDDFWDDWHALRAQMDRCRRWASIVGPGHWPDADMLPLGHLRFGEPTKFTPDEQTTMLTLWAIFRSPLMLGCDLTKLDDATLALITNPEVLAVNQASFGGYEFSRGDGTIVWIAQAEGTHDLYVAMFNTGESIRAVEVGLHDIRAIASAPELRESKVSAYVEVRDLWSRRDLSNESEHVSATLRPHAAALYRLRPIYAPAEKDSKE
jgi:hypothetical protein